MKRAALLLSLLLCGPARADDAADMASAANTFYATYLALPRAGGIPDAAARAKLAALLSPRLGGLIGNAAAAETRFRAQHKNAPPLIEGDLFSSLFEGITTYRVGACSGNAASGGCTVTLTHADPKKPVTWNDTLLLVKTPAGWKLDDVAYKAGFVFGNTGLLSETLRIVIAQAP